MSTEVGKWEKWRFASFMIGILVEEWREEENPPTLPRLLPNEFGQRLYESD